MSETLIVSQYITVGEHQVDVSKFVDTIPVGTFFQQKDLMGNNSFPIPGLPKDIIPTPTEVDNLFMHMQYFAHIKWNPTVSNSEEPGKPGFTLISKHQPEELVVVGKVDSLISQKVVPVKEVDNLDPDWMVLYTLALAS